MKYNFSFGIFLHMLTLMANVNSYGQTLDSLLLVIHKASNPEVKLDLLMRIGWSYENNQAFAKALEYYQQALDLKKTASMPIENELAILKRVAYCYEETGNYQQEIEVYIQILKIYEQGYSTSDAIKALQTISGLYFKTGNLIKAAEYNEIMLNMGLREKNYLWMAIAYNNLGVVYSGLKNEKKSSDYFSECYQLVKNRNTLLSDDSRATVLTNLAISYTSLGKLNEAQYFLKEALSIRQNAQDTVMIAQALNYLSSYEYIQDHNELAMTHVNEAVALLQKVKPSEESQATLGNCYKILAEIMLRKEDLAGFKKYNQLYNQQQLDLIEKERKRNKQLLEHHIEVEKKEYQMTKLLSERERQEFKLRQAEMEQQQKEDALKLQASELLTLKQQNELQNIRFKNQELEKEKISQTLELIQERAAASEQQQKLSLLEKDKALQVLLLEKRKSEIEQLEKDKQNNARIRSYGLMILLLLTLLLLVTIVLFWNRNKKNKILARQSKMISEMNQEIMTRNEELETMNDQLNLRSEELSERNNKLTHAQQIIREQNEKLQSYNNDLALEVDKRTKELTESNAQLVQHTTKLEQFTYALSHNIRAPLARLLGLTDLVTKTGNEAEKNFIIQKIQENSLQLDDVIKDLNQILSMKKTLQLQMEEVDLRSAINNVLLKLDNLVQSTNPKIITDISRAPIMLAVSLYIENIFCHLISNAIKYRSPDRPCVINICSESNADHIHLTVSDNGMGIDLTQHREKMFGLYKRFHPFIEGKGLGLYLVKTQVEAMSGHIEVSSIPDHGTTFRIIISGQKNSIAADQELITSFQ
jgi:signal transduction histidine kinase